MEIFRIENLKYKYNTSDKYALDNISLSIDKGEFVTICGPSGSGKSTLLRCLKPVLNSYGKYIGDIFYEGESLEKVEKIKQICEIGYVSQFTDSSIVTDKVYHELAFGMESLHYDNNSIKQRVAEMTSFFGIGDWFYKNVNELSGGQKQILTLASVMTLLPKVIILDEPTSQLDPIAAVEFVNILLRINKELGITIIITEHRLNEIIQYSDKIIVMDEGKIFAEGEPLEVLTKLKNDKHKMYHSMPAAYRLWSKFADNKKDDEIASDDKCPLNVNQARKWFLEFANNNRLIKRITDNQTDYKNDKKQSIIECESLYFKYNKNDKNILKGVNLCVHKGEIIGLLGENGTGKSTFLSVLCGVRKKLRGRIIVDRDKKLCLLPQNPKSLFVKKKVYDELLDVCSEREKIEEIIKLCRLTEFLDSNPFDLSGGEQQRVAFAKLLLINPDILLLDEVTKGLDNEYKNILGNILKELAESGKTIIIVSHDVEFCAEFTEKCGLFFDGEIVSYKNTREFFVNNNFYTTEVNRITRDVIENAIIVDDVKIDDGKIDSGKCKEINSIVQNDKLKIDKASNKKSEINSELQKEAVINKDKMKIRFIIAAMIAIIAIPVTIYVGIKYFNDEKYLFISLLIMFEAMAPFFIMFEGKSKEARELVIIACLCAICVAGRMVFYMLPEFKPVIAIVVISGVNLGAETGFVIGAISMLASNIIFGQGPWTPWQMFAMGMIGFLSGLIFYRKDKKREKTSILMKIVFSTFGVFCALIIYGGIMNPAAAIMAHMSINKKVLLTYYLSGLPVDIVHALATFIFIFILFEPMTEKINRVKIKYE